MMVLLDSMLSLGVVPILIGPLALLLSLLMALGASLLQKLRPSSIKLGLRVLWRNKVGLAVTILLTVGWVRGLAWASARLAPQASRTELGQTDWPMFRGGLTRTGAAGDGAPDPTAPAHIWNFTKDTKTFFASPSIWGNRIFITSVAGIGPLNPRGTGAIYCLDADNGKMVWYHSSGFRATFSSPVVSSNYLVCGEGLHLVTDARINCLRLIPEDYQELWSFPTRSHVESTPCIYEGHVYVGAGDDGFYCIQLEPGKDGQALVKWHLKGPKEDPESRYADCEASPAATRGKVYFCLGMSGQAVVCVDAATGVEKWRQPAPYPVFGHPTIVDNRLFVGMGNGNFVETAEQVREKELAALQEKGASKADLNAAAARLGPGGQVWCLNADTGEVIWKEETPQCILGAVAVSDGRLYFGDRGGLIQSMTLDRKSVRRRHVHEPILSSPAIGRDHAYFLTDKGHLYCLDKRTLAEVWTMPVGKELCLSSPALGRGHLYVGTSDNGLICVGQSQVAEKSWAGVLGGPGKSGWTDRSPVPEKMKFGWRYPADPPTPAGGEETPEMPLLVSAPAVVDGSLYLCKRGATPGLVRLALSENPSQPFKEKWFTPLSNVAVDGPVIAKGCVALMVGAVGDPGRKLEVLDAEQGRLLATRAVPTAATGRIALLNGLLLCPDAGGRLSAVELGAAAGPLGAPLWTSDLAGWVGMPGQAGDLVLVSLASPPSVAAVCRLTGKTLWIAALSAAPTTGPVVWEGCLAVGTAAGVVGLQVVDGAPAWRIDTGTVVDPMVADATRLAFLDDTGTVHVADWAGGIQISRPGLARGITPMLCGESLIVMAPDRLEKVDLNTKESRRLAGGLGWLGAPNTPAIMIQSQLFYGTTRKGLVCMKPK